MATSMLLALYIAIPLGIGAFAVFIVFPVVDVHTYL